MQDLGKIVIDVREAGGHGVPSSGVGGYEPAKYPMVRATDYLPSAPTPVSGAMAGISPVQITDFVKNIVRAGTDIRSQLSVIGEGMALSGTTVGTALLGVAATVGIAAVSIGALIAGTVAAAKALTALHRFVMDFASDIRDYSPAVQMAEFGNEIQGVLTRFRLGAVLGGSVAGQIQQAGRIERSLLEIRGYASAVGAQFLEPITKAVADLLDTVVAHIPRITELLASVVEGVGAMLSSIGSFLTTSSLFGNPMIGILMSVLGLKLQEISKNIAGIEKNTRPIGDFSNLNQPFTDDILLMTGKAI